MGFFLFHSAVVICCCFCCFLILEILTKYVDPGSPTAIAIDHSFFRVKRSDPGNVADNSSKKKNDI